MTADARPKTLNTKQTSSQSDIHVVFMKNRTITNKTSSTHNSQWRQ